MNKLFINYLSCVVASEGLPERTQEAIKLEYQDLAYASTNSKSVLGSMNDLAFHYKHHILSEGGIYSAMIPEIIRKLNHMPMGALDYKYPIDAIQSLYGRNNMTSHSADHKKRRSYRRFVFLRHLSSIVILNKNSK